MKLSARIDGSESPVNGCLCFIALILNRFDLSLESRFISDPPLQTLPTKDAQFDLRHIQPASVLWRVVKFQSLEYSSCHFWGERFVERRRFVSIQIVHHHTYAIGIRIPLLGKPSHLAGEVLIGAPLGYLDVPGATAGLANHEQVSGSVAPVFIVKSLPTTRLRLKGLSSLLYQLVKVRCVGRRASFACLAGFARLAFCSPNVSVLASLAESARLARFASLASSAWLVELTWFISSASS